MNQTVLPQLQEIESDLAEQEASMTALLEEVRDKLKGMRSVLPLFGEEPDAVEETQKATATQTKKSKTVKKAAAKKAPVEKAEDDSEKSTKKKATAKTEKTSKKKKDGRAAIWQKYMRPGVNEQTIPEAVRVVLATQPDKSFKIAEVMDALFADMPKTQYLKARNRISNVLSGGVRDNEWYKGDRGTYRLAQS